MFVGNIYNNTKSLVTLELVLLICNYIGLPANCVSWFEFLNGCVKRKLKLVAEVLGIRSITYW